MKDIISDEMQMIVNETLIRHHGLLDIMSKLSESSAKVNRSVVKSVTSCGCMQIEAKKVAAGDMESLTELKKILDKHTRGELCPDCREKVVSELGQLVFYMTALCNNLDINLYDVMLTEYKKIKSFGPYNLT
jgi:phosphoribosyl-ATP pyrophosphohydrolase